MGHGTPTPNRLSCQVWAGLGHHWGEPSQGQGGMGPCVRPGSKPLVPAPLSRRTSLVKLKPGDTIIKNFKLPSPVQEWDPVCLPWPHAWDGGPAQACPSAGDRRSCSGCSAGPAPASPTGLRSSEPPVLFSCCTFGSSLAALKPSGWFRGVTLWADGCRHPPHSTDRRVPADRPAPLSLSACNRRKTCKNSLLGTKSAC